MRRVKQSKDRRNRERPYIVRWSDGLDPGTGKVRWLQRSFRYKLDAENFAAAKRVEDPPPEPEPAPEPVSVPLKAFLRDWAKTRTPTEYRPGTRKLDDNACTRLLQRFGPTALLPDITPMEAAKFFAELTRMDGRPGPLSASSRSRVLRNAKTIFNVAVEWELIPRNPFAGIKRPKLPPSRWYYLPPDEFYAILNAAKGRHTVPLRYKVIYALAYCCALRLGEVMSLTWADNLKLTRTVRAGVETTTGEVHIFDRRGTPERPPFSVKDKEKREIRIPRRCLELLLDLRDYNAMTDQTPYVALDQQQYQTMTAKWARCQASGREWRNRDMANNTLTVFKRHVKWAKLTPDCPLTLHGLRKCCITNWANHIPNPEVVRVLAGHSDLKTTMQYYSQVLEEQRRKAAEATDRLMEMGLAAGTGTYEG